MSDIAQIRVRLLADLADLEKMKSQANSAFGQINRAAKSEMREANGAIALIGEEIGVRLPRHVRTFVAGLPGVAGLIAAAFPVAAVLGLGMALVEAGKKVAEFAQQQREAAEKLRESQEAFGLTAQQTYNSFEERLLTAGIKTDELRHDHVDALKKQLELIDMQGFDHLSSAFEKLEQSADKVFDNIKTNWLTVLTQFSFDNAAGFKGSLQRFGSDYQSLLAQGKGDDAQRLLDKVQKREEQNRADIVLMRASGLTTDSKGLYFTDSEHQAALGRLRANSITDYSDESYNAATQVTSALEAQQNIAALGRQNTTADRGNATQTAANQMASDLLKNLEEQLNQQVLSKIGTATPFTESGKLDFWKSHLNDFGAATDQYKAVIAKIAEVTATLATTAHESLSHLRDSIKANRETDAKFSDTFGLLGNKSILTTSSAGDLQHSKDAALYAVEQAKNNAALQEAIIRYQQVTGAIGTHTAALETLQAKQSEISAQYLALGVEIDDLKTQAKNSVLDPDQLQALTDKIAALKGQQTALQNESYAAQLVYQEQTMSATDQVFAHLAKGAQDLDTKIASIMERTIDGLNDQFVGAMFGDKTNFGKVFEQASRSLTKTALEYIEGSLTGKGHGSKGKIGDLKLSATNGSLNVHVTGSSSKGGSGSTDQDGSTGSSKSGVSSLLKSIPGLSSLSNSSAAQWLKSNGGKFAPGGMEAVSGLMEMFSGPTHTHGEGSGVANALADANHRQNSLSRLLMGMGSITKGAGSMMFGGMGGSGAMDAALQKSNVGSGMSFMLSNILPSLEGFASGGDPVGGVPIEVGEIGPEVWTPPSSGGHITPNRDLDRSGGDHYTIDARGTDPALTQVNVARAIAMSHQQAVREAQRSMTDRQTRVPR